MPRFCYGRHSHALDAIDPPGERVILGRILANEIADDALHFFQQLVVLGDKFRSAVPQKSNTARSPTLRAPSILTQCSLGIFPPGTDQAGAAVINGAIGSAGEIEPAFRFMDRKRVALLIQAVGGNGNWRGTPLRRHAVQFKTFMVEHCQDGVAAAREATQRRAFDDLGQVHGARPTGKPVIAGRAAKIAGVAGAARNDDIDARGERALERAHAHLADDVRGGVDIVWIV